MCGITGFNWNDEKLIKIMTKILYHRGPDQGKTLVDDRISLGHRRLSIIDLSDKGKQPMSNEDGSIYLVYNGEIYNYKSLRQDLERMGHNFFSNTDSEVIIHSYEQWGEECVNKFNGMFAFCIWDSIKNNIFLARDRLGIKPLYYYNKDDRFIFASEIKSILQDKQIKREIDETALYYYLGYEYIPAPLTIFKNIKKLLPGHTLLYKSGSIIIKQFWKPGFQQTHYDENYYAKSIFKILKESVEKRLISDVPIGAFLSGGIDSSAIVGFMSESLEKPVNTFSIGYKDETYSELEYARTVSEYFGTNHTELIIDPLNFEKYEDIIWYLDEPLSEFSILPVYLFCKKARRNITVALSGEGGDELFAGYDRFVAHLYDRYYVKIPRIIRTNLIVKMIDKFKLQEQKRGLINDTKKFLEGSNKNVKGQQMRWQYFSDKEEECKLYSDEFKFKTKNINNFEYIEKYYKEYKFIDEINKQINIELNTFLLNNCLVKVDKMSMANSLEVRVPYLDHHLVEFCSSVPGYYKLKNNTTKYILKKSMRNFLPKNIINRKKQGFSMPIKNWLKDELKDYMINLLSDSEIINKYLDTYHLNKIIKQHLNGYYNHSHRLWSLINLELWYKKIFINNTLGI